MDQGGAQKSLAEIQAEEEGQERDRQERERKEKKARQKGTICFLGAMELVLALLKIEIFLPSAFTQNLVKNQNLGKYQNLDKSQNLDKPT